MKRIFVWRFLVLALCATGSRAADTTATGENPRQLSDSIVVSANRFGLSPKKSVWPAAIIDLGQTQASTSFKQSLDGRDGLDIRQYNGVGSVTTLSSWGMFNRNMLLLYNGRVVKDYSLGGFNLADFSPDEFERVELVKGPQSVLYGSDAIGGVVNLISRTSLADRVEFTSRVGSYDLQQYFVSASRQFHGIGVGGFSEFDKSDNNRPNAGSRRLVIGMRSDYLSASGRHRASVSGRYFRDSLGVPGPAPDPSAIPVYGSAEASSLRDHQLDDNYSVDASYRYTRPQIGEAQFDLFWEKKNLDYRSLYNYQSFYYTGVPDSVLNVDSVDVTARSIYNKRSSGISGRFLHEGGRLTYSGGIDWLSGSLRATESDMSDGTNITGPNAPSHYSYPTYSFWSKGQNQLDVWSGSTFDVTRTIHVDLSGRLQFVTNRRTQPTWDIGTIYAPRSNLRFKLGYGYAFRLPTIAEQYANDLFTAGNANLAAETSQSLVSTVQWESADRAVTSTATAFHQHVGSLIQYVYDTLIYRSVPVNVNRFTSDGVDVEMTVSPSSSWNLSWSGVWQRARQTLSQGGPMVAAFYVPSMKWRGDVTMKVAKGLVSTAGVEYTSDREILLYGSVPKRIEKVYTFRIGMTLEVSRGLSAGVTGYDLTNRRRPEQFGFSPTDRDYPSPGRTVIFQVHAAVL